jgi:hypothetical protein
MLKRFLIFGLIATVKVSFNFVILKIRRCDYTIDGAGFDSAANSKCWKVYGNRRLTPLRLYKTKRNLMDW